MKTATKKKAETSEAKIGDLHPDERNANLGTERGMGMLEASLERYGAGRSILIDRNGRIIAGNKTAEKAGALGMEDVVVVESDGTKLVAVKRMDLDLETDEAARALALADNRVAEIDLAWSPSGLAEVVGMGAGNLDVFFTKAELAKMMTLDDPDEEVVLLDQAVQVRPAREYVVVLCGEGEEGERDFERLRDVLKLKMTRRGGYRSESEFDDHGIERVVTAARFFEAIGK